MNSKNACIQNIENIYTITFCQTFLTQLKSKILTIKIGVIFLYTNLFFCQAIWIFKCRCLNNLCRFLLYSTAKIIITFTSLSAIQNIIHFIFQFETTHVHSRDLQLEGTGAEEHNFYLLSCRSHYRFNAKEDNEISG